MVGVNINLNQISGMDFKRNKESSFQNTIALVSNLINELDNRARKIRAKKKNAVLWYFMHILNQLWVKIIIYSIKCQDLSSSFILYQTFYFHTNASKTFILSISWGLSFLTWNLLGYKEGEFSTQEDHSS